MKRRDREYLGDIRETSEEILELTEVRSREELESELMFRRSLERCFGIIGEAANGLTDDFKDRHSDIPWQKIISMRNHLIHAYKDVDYDILWDASKNNIPELLEFLDQILEDK